MPKLNSQHGVVTQLALTNAPQTFHCINPVISANAQRAPSPSEPTQHLSDNEPTLLRYEALLTHLNKYEKFVN